jgi:hypothetical protein
MPVSSAGPNTPLSRGARLETCLFPNTILILALPPLKAREHQDRQPPSITDNYSKRHQIALGASLIDPDGSAPHESTSLGPFSGLA